MSVPKTLKRLIVCFGSIQLVTVLSVLKYREETRQELNLNYENYLIVTPLFAPQGQNEEFAAFIGKMAQSICSWERIVYMPLEQKRALAKKLKQVGFSKISSSVCELIGSKHFDEIYLAHEYDFEDQLLMNVYDSAEKICYGNGIGVYTAQSAFPPANPLRDSHGYLHRVYMSLKQKLKSLLPQKQFLDRQTFDLGYFSLPSGFGQEPLMPTVILNREVYRGIFQRLREKLDRLINIQYVDVLRNKIQTASVSILLTSNFSESGRVSEKNEIAAYREFLKNQGISNNEILLIKPHPRTSRSKLLQLQSALSDLYADIILLAEDFLFYLPFEILFMEVFLSPDFPKVQSPRIFTFSSACLTLEFVLDADCITGFGNDIVEKFFYPDHASSRIEHEVDLRSTIQGIRHSNAALV